MKKQFAYLLVCLFFSCQSSAPEQKKGLPTAKTIKQDSVSLPKEIPKDTLPEATYTIWEIIKQKAKLPFSNEWKVPEQYNPALTCVKMTSQDFALLGLKGLHVENPYMPANFFHSHKVFQDFIIVAVVVEVVIYTQGIELLAYDKAGKLIDRVLLALNGGDGGWVWNSQTRFLNDNTFEITRDSSYLSLRKYPNIYHKSTQKVSLSKAGKFSLSPLQYIIQKPQNEWLKKGEENMKRLSKGDTL